MAATAAIYHHPDAVERPDTPLAGRRTAGQSFLKGYARHVDAEVLHAAADRTEHLDLFRELMTGHGWQGGIKGRLISAPETLSDPGTLMVPGPNLGSYAWTRRRAGQAHYGICGITHTVSTRRIMEGLTDMLLSPIESWDTVICTSRAVKSVLDTQFDAVEAYITQRFGARRVPRPHLPVIPLGVDVHQFARSASARATWRENFGLAEDDVAILSMGRLSISEKMHPAPLMIAAQQTAQASDKRIVLLMAGWFGDDTTRALHEAMARELAPDVTVHFPDGRDDVLRYEIWSAADIFALPVDSIQETYGLAPVEAMAAGLPVVCSDWNGFKDTIEDGVTGIRVRTLMAAPDEGWSLAARFENGQDNYHHYLVSVHQRTAVDVPELAAAFTALANDPGRRAAMGAAGLARARRLYDWATVIPQYQALWGEMTARRTHDLATSPPPRGGPWNPNSIDPFRLYARYPSAVLHAQARLSADRDLGPEALQHLMTLTGAIAFKRMVCPAEDLAVIHHAVRTLGPVSYGELLQRSEAPPGTVESAVLWMLKYDLVRVEM